MSTFESEGGSKRPGWFAKRKPTKFGAKSTAEEVCPNWDGSGKVAIVTGGYSGIGQETSRVLAAKGCEVIIGGRSADKGQEAIDAIKKQHPEAKVRFRALNLSSLKSVADFVGDFKKQSSRLDLLINNAGIMACPFEKSEEGLEMQFATNHLGHFLLTVLLLDTLKATGKKTGQRARIVNVSSYAHTFSGGMYPRFDKLDSPEGYSRWTAYGDSKLCNVLFARSLDERMKKENAPVLAFSLHPGAIQTNLQRHTPKIVMTLGALFFGEKTIPQGAATQVLLATADESEVKSGEYYSDCAIEWSTPYAHDRDMAEKLWEKSEELCKEYMK